MLRRREILYSQAGSLRYAWPVRYLPFILKFRINQAKSVIRCNFGGLLTILKLSYAYGSIAGRQLQSGVSTGPQNTNDSFDVTLGKIFGLEFERQVRVK